MEAGWAGSAGAVAAAGICTLSVTEEEAFLLVAIVSKIDVQNNKTAKAAVSLLIKLKAVGLAKILSAPEAPKMPAAEPFPLCKRTKRISKIHVTK